MTAINLAAIRKRDAEMEYWQVTYSGPLADPPRDPATVDRGWVRHAVGLANSGHPEEL